jgi:hypothetical protein
MQIKNITIRATEYQSAREAIRHLSDSDDDRAILLQGKYLVAKRADVERLTGAGVMLAYLYDRHGTVITLPVNDH